MRTIYHIFLIILLFDVSISGQSLNGTGTDATGGKAEVGQEYNYRFDDPFLIQDSIGYLKSNVNNGKIISDGNGSSDAKIKWTGFPASVTISGAYEVGSDSPKSYGFGIAIVGDDDMSKADL